MARFYIALHAAVPAALAAVLLLHLFPPAGLEPLARRPAWTVWALIAGWLLLSALLAAVGARASTLWRSALALAGALLALAGAAGWALGAPLAPAMLAGLGVSGLACAGIAAFIGPKRVQAERPVRAAAAHRTAPDRSRRGGLRRHAVHLPFWLAGLLAAESFRLAHVAAAGPARPAAMLGLLLACLIALPAATLRLWLPRTSTALWVLAALSYAALAARSGLGQAGVAAGLCAVAAVHAARGRRHNGAPQAASRRAG
ncbi:hypothetical protein M4R22_02980 [Acidovorax sp. GBBC 3334]|uniref:hypothetical protein n=1 Tax=Acidovorax sp. GBBC 3334 TaxID=2940496 RepID=UPI002304B36A|nr:hypothetical protein [Acidovorax sp. GBBC 3334]MDA8453720.1 hypothetical protein [Acidovorax sp. GBBC 3334]